MRAPVPAALPAEATLARSQSGIRPEHHRVLGVDLAAERAGERDAVDLLDAEMVHQQARAGIERGLGELDRAHVGLQDPDLGLALVQQIGMRAAVRLDPRADRRLGAVDRAVLAEDARQEHLGQHLDDARAADAR